MDLGLLIIIIQLVFLEGILSIDNAAVLGAMVLHLPNDKPIPWPTWMRVTRRFSASMGSQRDAALRVGLLGAYAGRALMLALAGMIIEIQWVRVLGAAYLLYLGIAHLGDLYREQQEQEAGHGILQHGAGFWGTVAATILADLAFSVDNVIAAVALSDKLWVVLLGVAIGMLIMRFAANLFSHAIAWEPALETGAYLLLLAIGIELLLKEFTHVHIGEFTQFGISIAILILTILFGRSPILRRGLVVFKPLMMLFAGLTWVVDQVKGLITSPFRRNSLPGNEA